MPTITLDQIKADVSARYEPVVIDLGGGNSVTLTQALRLPKDKRRKIMKLQKSVNELDQSADDALDKIVDGIGAIIRTAATKASEANALLASVGDDLAVLTMILEKYGEATQLPEASPSPS